MAPTNPIIDLSDVRMADNARTGPKMARLGELAAQGWRVPDGYVLTVDVLRQWLPASIRRELERLFDGSTMSSHALEQRASQAQELIEDEPITEWLQKSVAAAHERLQQRTGLGQDLRVAVRSSAVSEDAAAASFAGQFDTYLGAHTSESVVESVRRCWASLYTARVLTYRQQHGMPVHSFDLAVGVMQLVEARSSGVAFTLDPVTGDRNCLVVQGNWGLGQSVVSGQVTPDHWVVDRTSGQIQQRHIADKHVWSVTDPAGGSAETVAAPGCQRERPCLDEQEVRHLCHQAVQLEEQEGLPQDLEWAIESRSTFPDTLVILQHRPETSTASQTASSGQTGTFDPVQYALRNVFNVSGT